MVKGKYFKQKSRVQALNCRYGSSHVWRSIIHGVDLLKEGYKWNMCNGKSINFWNDKWLSNTSFVDYVVEPLAWGYA